MGSYETDYFADKYFIPGYTGFCPYLEGRIGDDYSQTTNEVIREYPYLATRLAPIVRAKSNYISSKPDVNYNYTSTFNSQDVFPKLPEFTVGYTGFVPRCLRRSCQICREDMNDNSCSCCHELCRSNISAIHGPQTIPNGTTVTSRIIPKYDPNCVCKPCAAVEDPYRTNYSDLACNYQQGIVSCPCHRPDSFQKFKNCGCYECCAIRKEFQNRCQYLPTPPPKPYDYVINAGREVSIPCPEGYRMNSSHLPERFDFPPYMEHREGGVIPCYTGFIPGYQNAYGETYGRASRRLLNQHFATMKTLQ